MPLEQIPNDPRLVEALHLEMQAELILREAHKEALVALRDRIRDEHNSGSPAAIVGWLGEPLVGVLDSMIALREYENKELKGRIELYAQVLTRLRSGIVVPGIPGGPVPPPRNPRAN